VRTQLSIGIGFLLAAIGCYDERSAEPAAASSSGDAGDVTTVDAASEPARPDRGPQQKPRAPQVFDAGEADGSITLECVRGAVSALHVEFECGTVTVYTCKDLSNLVVEFEDGTRERFEGQSGNVNSFSGTGANAGKRIIRVWVKAGANHSGDGPGYGQRVETTTALDECDPPAAGSGGSGGAAGCIEGPDVPCSPIPTGGVGGAGGAGAGGTGGAAGEDGPQ
jgi:hypothetical protein